MDAAHYLSENLRSIRSLQEKSQTEFAQEVGISKSTLQEIEQGRSPNLSTVDCIARHLDLPVSALVSEVLPAGQMSVLIHIFQYFTWFSRWPRQDQLQFLRLSHQLTRLLEKHLDPGRQRR